MISRVPGELQIGVGSTHRVRVPDTPAVRRVLAVLARGEAPRDAPTTRRVLGQLGPVLRDGDTLVHPRIPAEEVAAAALRHPYDATERLYLREQQRVQVAGDLGLAPEVDPTALLRRCGLGIAAEGETPTAVLMLERGEPERTDLDHLVHRGTPHLVLRAVESEIVLGPFVYPGRTACLRCLDAHATAQDQTYPMVLDGYHRALRHDGVADPIDAAVAVAALGWAVSDLVRFAEQDRPTTWSATIAFASGREPRAAVPWLRHPRCGCSWGAREELVDLEGESVTMGA